MGFTDKLRLKDTPIPLIPSQEMASEPKLNRSNERFIRGPFPAKWMEHAARLPGRALHVALMIQYLDGFEKTGTVRLKPSVRRAYGIDRYTASRALVCLETAGLVKAERRRGAAPLVTILSNKCSPSTVPMVESKSDQVTAAK